MTVDELKREINSFSYTIYKTNDDCDRYHEVDYFVNKLLEKINILNLTKIENNIIFGNVISIENSIAKVLLKDNNYGKI